MTRMEPFCFGIKIDPGAIWKGWVITEAWITLEQPDDGGPCGVVRMRPVMSEEAGKNYVAPFPVLAGLLRSTGDAVRADRVLNAAGTPFTRMTWSQQVTDLCYRMTAAAFVISTISEDSFLEVLGAAGSPPAAKR